MTMRSREFLRRLDRLRFPAEEEPKKVYDFGVLSRVENARFWELYRTFRDDHEDLTEAERKEFWMLLSKCPLVDTSEIVGRSRETNDERRERRQLEWAFGQAFHNYAMRYSFLAIPNYGNSLNQYRLEVGYRLFDPTSAVSI
jgi:hypothetical protein